MPDGPIIMSSDRILKSFKREVIHKRPDVFKVAVLREITPLFPHGFDETPFFAGFGNRETDAIAYINLKIPTERSFIINPEGEIF